VGYTPKGIKERIGKVEYHRKGKQKPNVTMERSRRRTNKSKQKSHTKVGHTAKSRKRGNA